MHSSMQHHAEKHLPPYSVRPRFRASIPYSPLELSQIINAALNNPTATCKGKLTGIHYITLVIPEADQHYWSPQLSITVEVQNRGSLIKGVYGPRPVIWTMFVFFYSIMGFITLVILMFGLSYKSLDLPAPFLWLVPLLLLIILSLYLVAYLGQKKGHDQMVVLHQFLEDTLDMDIR